LNPNQNISLPVGVILRDGYLSERKIMKGEKLTKPSCTKMFGVFKYLYGILS